MADPLDAAMDELNAQIARIKGATMEGLLEAGRLIQAEAAARVPVVTGELRDSGYTRQIDANTVEVGFEAEHATLIHSDDDMKLEGEPRPDGGVFWGPEGMADFLTEAAEANASKVARIVKDRATG